MEDKSGSKSAKFSVSMSRYARERLEKMAQRTGFTVSKVLETMVLLHVLPISVIPLGEDENPEVGG